MNTTLTDPDVMSIADAAEHVGVSRRTIERWIGADRLEAIPSEVDRRKRLVRVSAVQALAAESRQRSPSELPGSLARAASPAQSNETAPLDDHEDFQEVIDNVLQLIYSHHHRLVSHLHPESFHRLTLEELREGPLGMELLRMSQVANGQLQLPRLLILKAIDTVLQALFWPAAADDYSVPRVFWDTDCGRMLALAKFRSYGPDDLLSVGEAAEQLGIGRPTLYRWMDDRSLSYVHDGQTGRTFVVRRDVEDLKRITRDWQASFSRSLEKAE